MESKRTPQSPLSELDSSGALLLNLTIPASDLTLGNKLGQGAYGTVYKAKWRNKDVAVKQLLLPNPSEQEKNEFKQEAAVMFQIAADSDHVVRLHKITMQPQLSLVMELMPNGSLYELLQNNRDKPLDWGIRYRLAMDISTGLEDIHSHGVLHRDLKSLNVLLDGNLRAKLTDFGLATTKLTSSRHSSVQGTPHWMAPEVANGDADSQGSDVYSLGMVFWELVTHRQPYANLKPMQVLGQVMKGKQETIPADCPATFKQLILDCWTMAEKRPKATQITTRLQPLLESKATVTNPVVSTTGAGVVLNSIPTFNLKGGPAYQSSSSSSIARPQSMTGAGGFVVEPKSSAAAEQMLFRQQEAEAELARQKTAFAQQQAEMEALKRQQAAEMEALKRQIAQQEAEAELARQKMAFAQQQAEMEALKKQMAQLQARDAVAPAVNPKPLRDNRGYGPGLFDQKPSPAAQPQVVDAKALGQLLKCVAEGEQDQAEALIKKDSKLLLAAGKVTDLSGRTFDNITAFQYALWAMDYHMWTMIQEYLPTEAQAKQHALLESKGTAHGKHFDLQPLLDALKTYVDEYVLWSTSQCGEHWCKKVGGAQKLLPAHVVNEYCRPDRSFNPCPAEWTTQLPRTRVAEIWDGSKRMSGGSWFAAPQLGVSFAFYRANSRSNVVALLGAHVQSVGEFVTSVAVGGAGTCDLKSLQALWNARTKQLKALAKSLTAESQSSMQAGLK